MIARCGIPQFDRILPQSLHLLLAQQWARAGIMTLHAAAVSTPGGGILSLGPRGAGTSTLTVSALAAGLGVITDDWMILGRAADGQIEVERLRGFLMLRRLVESSMPLLFSAEFGHEHRALLDTARQLISSAPCQALEPGTDIVSRPAQAWSRLLSAALAA